jgi:hypothetical protein
MSKKTVKLQVLQFQGQRSNNKLQTPNCWDVGDALTLPTSFLEAVWKTPEGHQIADMIDGAGMERGKEQFPRGESLGAFGILQGHLHGF